MNDWLFLGIDPGKSGCLSILNYKGELHAKILMPVFVENKKTIVDIKGLDKEIKKYSKKIKYAMLEKVHAMPNQGVTSMFSFGRTYGACEMCLASNKIKYDLVTPQAWQKVMFVGVKGTDSKEKSIKKARELWPDLDFKRTKKCKNQDHNFTDSLLIAKYAIINKESK